jgi:hypothetical protein
MFVESSCSSKEEMGSSMRICPLISVRKLPNENCIVVNKTNRTEQKSKEFHLLKTLFLKSLDLPV